MIYYIALQTKSGKLFYVLHYDHKSNELLLSDNAQERQEYLSMLSLLDELNLLIKNQRIDLKEYKIVIGAW